MARIRSKARQVALSVHGLVRSISHSRGLSHHHLRLDVSDGGLDVGRLHVSLLNHRHGSNRLDVGLLHLRRDVSRLLVSSSVNRVGSGSVSIVGLNGRGRRVHGRGRDGLSDRRGLVSSGRSLVSGLLDNRRSSRCRSRRRLVLGQNVRQVHQALLASSGRGASSYVTVVLDGLVDSLQPFSSGGSRGCT